MTWQMTKSSKKALDCEKILDKISVFELNKQIECDLIAIFLSRNVN